MRATSAPDSQVVRLGARVDATTVAETRRELHAALAVGTGDLVVDLTDVAIVDAAGLGMLVAAHRRAADLGRRLVLRGVPASMSRVLAMTRLHRVLNVERGAGLPASVG